MHCVITFLNEPSGGYYEAHFSGNNNSQALLIYPYDLFPVPILFIYCLTLCSQRPISRNTQRGYVLAWSHTGSGRIYPNPEHLAAGTWHTNSGLERQKRSR